MMTQIAMRDVNATMLAGLIDGEGTSPADRARYEMFLSPQGVDKFVTDALNERYIPELRRITPLIASTAAGPPHKLYEAVFKPNENNLDHIGSIKRIAMFTTAKARCRMITAMIFLRDQDLLMKDVYYMDTDSFFLSELANQHLKKKGLLHQLELGYFKDEYPNAILTRGQFIAPKVYFFYTDNGEFHGKFKGVSP